MLNIQKNYLILAGVISGYYGVHLFSGDFAPQYFFQTTTIGAALIALGVFLIMLSRYNLKIIPLEILQMMAVGCIAIASLGVGMFAFLLSVTKGEIQQQLGLTLLYPLTVALVITLASYALQRRGSA